jgi:predicted dehydrogenase
MNTKTNATGTSKSYPVRWGFVGTGNIATWMAEVVNTTPAATLCAVASRHLARAQSFATEFGVERAFDSWAEMFAWDDLDAVYVATPTSLREEISIAAANAGKHVLGEKPFANLRSLERITAACRENEVAFMDATHFVHHPRYAEIQQGAAEMIGRPRSLESNFLISLTNREDIRYDPALEPLGAIGDLGWYNMRATLEYLAPAVSLRAATAQLQRDTATGAIIAGQGSLTFDDDSVSHWQCGFDAATVDIGLTLSGSLGVLRMDNFIGEDEDHAASYRRTDGSDVSVSSRQSGPALMFEDFAAAIGDASLRERWMQASERTQALLDAAMGARRTDV